MAKGYSIKEISKLTSITVRTLHHYDEINLLTPKRSLKNHRIYSDNDLIRLQQIITLKYLGFSLLQIKKILHKENVDVIELLKVHIHALSEETIRIKKISHLLNYIVNHSNLNESIDWSNVIKITEIIKLKRASQAKWYELYLTKTEIDVFTKFAKKRTQQWINLIKEIKAHVDCDPESNNAKKLVKKWDSLANQAYSKHPELKHKLWEGYKAGIIPGIPYDKKVINFITKVTNKLHK